MAGSESEQHYVGSLSELSQSGRKNVIVNGKSIFLIYCKNEVFVMDSYCYHAGGPLYTGDIEDVSGLTCIICPWHKYKISLHTGEGLYHSVDPYNPSKPPKLKSKGIKQRSHKVTVKGDDLYVELSVLPMLESDHYNKVSGTVT